MIFFTPSYGNYSVMLSYEWFLIEKKRLRVAMMMKPSVKKIKVINTISWFLGASQRSYHRDMDAVYLRIYYFIKNGIRKDDKFFNGNFIYLKKKIFIVLQSRKSFFLWVTHSWKFFNPKKNRLEIIFSCSGIFKSLIK